MILSITLPKTHQHRTYLPSLVKSNGTPPAEDSVKERHVHAKSSGVFEELATGASSTIVASLLAACFRLLPFFGVSETGGFCTPCIGAPLTFDAAIAGVESTVATGTGIAAPNRVTLSKKFHVL